MTEWKNLLSEVEGLKDKVQAQGEHIETLEEEIYELRLRFDEAWQEAVNEAANEDEATYAEQVAKLSEYINSLEKVKKEIIVVNPSKPPMR